MAHELIPRANVENGFTLIEVMLAMLVLLVGILATFGVYDVSKRATHVSELQEAAIHLAQREVQRLESLPYTQIGLVSAPGTSASPTNPGHFVSGSSSCPSFQWNQSAGTSNNTDPLVVNGCTYSGTAFSSGTVAPPPPQTLNGVTYTVYDYVTWVSNDSICIPGTGCPVNNDYKRITVEVTNNASVSGGPTIPALVSSIVTDPHALPVVGNPNVLNPLNNPATTCTDGSGNQVSCEYGLGTQTPNTYYLTDTLQSSSYSPPTGDNPCMHYTNAQLPLLGLLGGCGNSNLGLCSLLLGLLGCPQPDLLNNAPPPSSITQEYNFSPNVSSTTAGRVILRDPNATGASPCAATPSNDARMGEFFATKPLGAQLNLSGNGGLTLYTSTLHGLSVSVTLCVGVYLESPVLNGLSQVLNLLDPLNILHSGDSIRLGVVAHTIVQWPAVPTPISFTFAGAFAAQAAVAGTSLGVRIWVAASSGDDIVVQYDAPTVRSSVQINSQ
jgi:prepilin-type N-terminal cleavage/methylation domain-containing protein